MISLTASYFVAILIGFLMGVATVTAYIVRQTYKLARDKQRTERETLTLMDNLMKHGKKKGEHEPVKPD